MLSETLRIRSTSKPQGTSLIRHPAATRQWLILKCICGHPVSDGFPCWLYSNLGMSVIPYSALSPRISSMNARAFSLLPDSCRNPIASILLHSGKASKAACTCPEDASHICVFKYNMSSHCSLPIAHCPLLKAHCSLLITHGSLLTAHCPLLIQASRHHVTRTPSRLQVESPCDGIQVKNLACDISPGVAFQPKSTIVHL